MKRYSILLAVAMYTSAVQGQTGHRQDTVMTEVLYNGIRLPSAWPPRQVDRSEDPVLVPYLGHPPGVIPINTGRQLFVDDFLIERRTLDRVFYPARKSAQNPLFKPETPVEMDDGKIPVAAPFNDGIWYDPADSLFKMWYHAGWFNGTAYAYSKDGLHWTRPDLDVVPGTNLVIPPRRGYRRDGATVWLDHAAQQPGGRYKMFLYHRFSGGEGGEIYMSADGIHWNLSGNTAPLGDNSSFFYNPFRKKWVFSIRDYWQGKRVRYYREADNFVEASQWPADTLSEHAPVFWQKADSADRPNKIIREPAQFYDADAVAYESIMLGLFTIHRGPNNQVAAFGGFPKITELSLGYSRDGFHYYRPVRDPFIAGTDRIGDWDRGYIHAVGGGCLVQGDSLYFYYSAWSGISPKLVSDMYAGGAMGLATLRRDGFASLETSGEGFVTTKPVIFTGDFLFVNTETPAGDLRVEVLDDMYRPIPFFTKKECIAVKVNSTKQKVTWKHKNVVSALKNKPVRLRFHLSNGKLFSFWVTDNPMGASNGYLGAGGPGYKSNVDSIAVPAIKPGNR